jgi:hypothetical protein
MDVQDVECATLRFVEHETKVKIKAPDHPETRRPSCLRSILVEIKPTWSFAKAVLASSGGNIFQYVLRADK